MFWGDCVGEVDFVILMGKLLVFYFKKMGGSCNYGYYFVVGVEVGVVQCSLDFLNLCWGLQYDGEGGFNLNFDLGEICFDCDEFLFGDLVVGLLWFMIFDKNNNFYFGGFFYYLNCVD